MSLASGVRLGAYEIVSLLGAGGMGEVYRARDTRLGREVVIKVLPSALSSDPDRLFPFGQEARAASALNHPNICSFFDIGAVDGLHYIVSELLEGETLRQRLMGGALPVRKAVEYAILNGPSYPNGFRAQYDVTRDGQRFLLNVPAEEAVPPSITVVMNWRAGVKK